MSYGVAAALQSAVYQALAADTVLGALVGSNIFDAAPPGAVPPIYVSLGPEDVRLRGDKSAGGAYHEFTISVVSDTAGFLAAKQAAVAVSDVLSDASLALSRGTLVAIWFQKARARRVQDGDTRRIDLRFRAYVTDEITP